MSDSRFESWTYQAVHLAETLSDSTEPVPVNLMHVHLLPDVEDDTFHELDPVQPADEENCLLSDTLDAILVEEPVADHQVHANTPPAAAPLVTSESVPMFDRELLMSDTNPVCLNAEGSYVNLISFSP